MNKPKLAALSAILLTVLLLGCGQHSSTNGSESIRGNVGVAMASGETGTVDGFVTAPNPDNLPGGHILGAHITFSAGGQTYSTDSEGLGWYSIELPSSSDGISYAIHVTGLAIEPYDGEVTVVTGTSVQKDIEVTRTASK